MEDFKNFIGTETALLKARIKELEAQNMAYEYDEAERARHPAPVPRPMILVFKQDPIQANKKVAIFKVFGEPMHYIIIKDNKRFMWKLLDATPFMEFVRCNDYTDGAMQAQAHFDKHVNLLLE